MVRFEDQIPSGEALLGHQGWVKGLARRLVEDVHGAEDLAQEVMAEALRRPPGFLAERSRLRRWLGGVARNLARDRQRIDAARRTRERMVARDEAEETSEGIEERLEVHRRLVEAVMALEEPYRSALVLHHFDGLASRDLAERMGVSEEAARKRLSRGHRKLRELLERRWGVRGEGLVNALVPLGLGLEFGGGIGLAEVSVLSTKRLLAVGILGIVGLLIWAVQAPEDVREVPLSGQDTGELAEVGATTDSADATVAGVDERREFAGAGGAHGDPVPEGLEIIVLDPEGSPLEGAEVFGFAETEIVFEGRTGGDGRSDWEGSDLAGGVLVHVRGFAPEVLELACLRGEHRIRISAGLELSGWVLVDDEVPAEPVEMRIEVNPGPDWLERVPEVLQARWTRYSSALSIPLVTESDGRFSIRGLPEGWSGSLYCDYGYWFVEAPLGGTQRTEHLVHLGAAQTGLELRLTRLPRVVGRLVDEVTGRGVPNVRLMVIAGFSDGEETPMISDSSEEGGWFTVALSPSSHASMLRFVDPGDRPTVTGIQIRSRGLAFHGVPVPPGASPYDIGEIEIPAVSDAVIRLVDGEGRALAGGEVALGGARFEGTGSDGIATLEDALLHSTEGWARAPGHRLIRFALGSDRGRPDAPVDIVLPSANRLTIRFAGPDDGRNSVAPPANLILRAKTMPFACPGKWTSMPFQVPDGGAEAQGSSWGTDAATVMYSVDGQRVVHFDDLNPGLELSVELVDHAGTVLCQDRVLVPAEDEESELVLRWSLESISVAGRVIDEHGGALAGVQVSIRIGEGNAHVMTDGSGAFEFENVHAGSAPAQFRAKLEGFTVGRATDVDLARIPEPFEIPLSQSEALVIRVFDSEGQPADVSTPTSVSLERGDYRRHDMGVGHYRLEGLPRGPHVLRFGAGDRMYEFEHTIGEGEAHFDLPPLGSLGIRVPGLAGAGRDIEVRLTPPERPEGAFTRSLRTEGGELLGSLRYLSPGPWTARLQEVHFPAGRGQIERVPLGASVEFEVVAGETTELVLGH